MTLTLTLTLNLALTVTLADLSCCCRSPGLEWETRGPNWRGYLRTLYRFIPDNEAGTQCTHRGAAVESPTVRLSHCQTVGPSDCPVLTVSCPVRLSNWMYSPGGCSRKSSSQTIRPSLRGTIRMSCPVLLNCQTGWTPQGPAVESPTVRLSGEENYRSNCPLDDFIKCQERSGETSYMTRKDV